MATQTITFNKEGDQYVARFEAAEDFALHIERDQVGPINVEASTIQGAGFAPVDDFPLDARIRPVLDYEFQGLVYPKYIKVTSDTAPAVAEVVSNGEITELKYQEKSVEVTANGNTEVIPDAGFMGLTKVNVSVNVPQSGGGEGGSGGGSNIEYIDFTNVSGAAAGIALAFSYFVKAVITSDTMGEIKASGMPAVVIQELAAGLGGKSTLIACAVDLTRRIKMSMGGKVQEVTVIEYGVGNGAKPEDFDALPRITEEEFYNLNA